MRLHLPGAYIEFEPNGRGGFRVAILSEKPLYNPLRGHPERPGVFCRPLTDDERALTLDQLRDRFVVATKMEAVNGR